jgi:hypothetical protein
MRQHHWMQHFFSSPGTEASVNARRVESVWVVSKCNWKILLNCMGRLISHSGSSSSFSRPVSPHDTRNNPLSVKFLNNAFLLNLKLIVSRFQYINSFWMQKSGENCGVGAHDRQHERQTQVLLAWPAFSGYSLISHVSAFSITQTKRTH